MTQKNFTSSFTVSQSPERAFAAINNVRGWWSQGLKGESDKSGGQFTYQHKQIHLSTQKVIALTPNSHVAWHVTSGNLNFVEDKAEWAGTDILFDIEPAGDKTKVTMTHKGLTPKLECFEACSGGWEYYFGDSLRKLIETGKGEPDPASFTAP